MKVTRYRALSAALAAVAGLTLSAGTPVLASGPPAPAWPQPRYNAAGTGYNPTETQLGTGNVGSLVTRAIAPLGRPFSAAAPVVAENGLVIVTGYYSSGGQQGEIEAFPESCGAPLGLSCKPAWKAFVSCPGAGSGRPAPRPALAH